jgi:hypothetical protein
MFYYDNAKCNLPVKYDIPYSATSEEKVELLKLQVENLTYTLCDCVNVVNDLQNALNQAINTVERNINNTQYEIERHAQGFHSMLIIGNKEGKKDESNIP